MYWVFRPLCTGVPVLGRALCFGVLQIHTCLGMPGAWLEVLSPSPRANKSQQVFYAEFSALGWQEGAYSLGREKKHVKT